MSLRRVASRTIPVTLAVQACSFLSSIALASVLGATSETDAYYVALAIPVFVSGILLAAVRLGAIPALTDANAEPGGDFGRGCSELVSAAALGAILLTVPVTAIAIAALPLLTGDAPDSTVSLARSVVLELSPLALFGALAGALGAILTVRGRYVVPIAVMAFEPIAKTILILTVADSLGAHALALGNVVGGALAVTTLMVALHRSGVRIMPADPRRSALLGAVLKLSVPLLIGQAVLQVNPIVDRLMTVSLAQGDVTMLELGFRLFNVPTALLASTLIAPVAATWAARYTTEGWPSLRDSLARALRAAALVLPALVALGIVLRLETVTMLYRGGEYGAAAVAQTAEVFGIFMAGLPGQVVVVAVAGVFIVQKDAIVPMLIAIVNVVLNVALDVVFRSWFGVSGIALSSTVTLTLLAASYLVLLRRRNGPLRLRRAGVAALRATVAAVLCGVTGWAVASLLPESTDRAEAIVVVIAAGAAGLVAYVAALVVLGERARPELPWRGDAVTASPAVAAAVETGDLASEAHQ